MECHQIMINFPLAWGLKVRWFKNEYKYKRPIRRSKFSNMSRNYGGLAWSALKIFKSKGWEFCKRQLSLRCVQLATLNKQNSNCLEKVSLNPTNFNPIFKYNFWNDITDFTTWTAEKQLCFSRARLLETQCHISDRSRVASAAIITAFLQGKAACKQESSGIKQVKPLQNDLEISKTWKQQVNFNGGKKTQHCSLES